MTLRGRGHDGDRGTQCTLRYAPPTLRCDARGGGLAGTTWHGEAIADGGGKRRLAADVRQLEARFLRRYRYGQVDAAFRCRAGCGPAVPRLMLLAWRGD